MKKKKKKELRSHQEIRSVNYQYRDRRRISQSASLPERTRPRFLSFATHHVGGASSAILAWQID